MNVDYLRGKLGNEVQQGLEDSSVNEISLNEEGRLWFLQRERGHVAGSIMLQHQAHGFVHAYAHYSNQFLNESKPYLDGILPFNGERINIVIPPITEGITFTIRKMASKVYTLQEYIEGAVMTGAQADVLKKAIKQRRNILISGGPGTGKTTLLNALLNEVAEVSSIGHRILILEQVRELKSRVLNCKPMCVTDKHDMRTLLWLAMRNSPDRIVMGEARDGAAYEMLKAWNTGCPGGMATVHANSPEAAVQRLIDLALEATPIPPYALIAETIDVIVQLVADPSSKAGRYVSDIKCLAGYDRDKKEFLFKNEGEKCE